MQVRVVRQATTEHAEVILERESSSESLLLAVEMNGPEHNLALLDALRAGFVSRL